MAEKRQRKPTRLFDVDYSSGGTFFLTICTKGRAGILSQIVGENVELMPCGKVAEKYLIQLNEFYEELSVEYYVIMPNHIHLLLEVAEREERVLDGTARQHSAVSSFVSTFKRFCNKEIGENIWQTSFYDHIVRDAKDYERHVNYILENPARWQLDDLHIER